MQDIDNKELGRGPDAPVERKENDHLGRWSTALEIFNIAQNSPSEWSVRIGMFGKWGAGKTSVLKFIEAIADGGDVVTVRFNPWECTSEQEMWLKFTDAVFNKLKEKGISVPSESKIRMKIRAAKVGGIADQATGAIGSAAETLGAPAAAQAAINGLRTVGGWLLGGIDFGKEDFTELAEVAKGKRILVLIDDLDRTETGLVPRLLYGLHELLDLPGFSFVLGFDPEVVGKALGNSHPGWGDGLRFLEKIIDFPIWLPEPTDFQLRKLLSAELTRYCPWIFMADVEPVFARLPRNPRSLKRFVRHLWRLGTQVDRHERKELNFSLLILINLFKADWPAAAHHVFLSKELLDEALTARRFNRLSDDKSLADKSLEKVKVMLVEVLKKAEISQQEAFDSILPRVLAIADVSGWLSAESIIYHARLSEDPPAFTWKEYQQFVATWTDGKTESLETLLRTYGTSHQIEHQKVVKECYEAALTKYLTLLDEAANTDVEEEFAKKLDEAEKHFSVVQAIALDLKYFGGENPILTKEHFSSLVESLSKWSHFNNHARYPKLRQTEHNLLLGLANTSERAEDCFSVAGPSWTRGFMENAETKKLYAEMTALIEPHLADSATALLRKDGGIQSLWDREFHHGLRYVLFDPKGALLGDVDRRAELLRTLKEASSNLTIAQNAIVLFHMFGVAVASRLDLDPEKMKVLATDHEMLLAVWEAAISHGLQPRALGSFLETRKKLLAATGIADIPLREWMTQEDTNSILVPESLSL